MAAKFLRDRCAVCPCERAFACTQPCPEFQTSPTRPPGYAPLSVDTPDAPPSRGVDLLYEHHKIYTSNGGMCSRCGKAGDELEGPCLPAFDDASEDDDIEMFESPITLHKEPTATTAADVLEEMATTFRERNAVYDSNYKMVAPLMRALFPDGVPSELVVLHQFHLFELMLVKLSRFATSRLQHQDSIHDAGVYAAMIEAIVINEENAA